MDKLVLAAVNAPYKRKISAKILARCLATGKTAQWRVHITTFFTDVSVDLMFVFAKSHDIPEASLAHAYSATKSKTGERNPNLEAALGAVATPAG